MTSPLILVERSNDVQVSYMNYKVHVSLSFGRQIYLSLAYSYEDAPCGHAAGAVSVFDAQSGIRFCRSGRDGLEGESLPPPALSRPDQHRKTQPQAQQRHAGWRRVGLQLEAKTRSEGRPK